MRCPCCGLVQPKALDVVTGVTAQVCAKCTHHQGEQAAKRLYMAVDQARLDEVRTALEGQLSSFPERYHEAWLGLASKFSEAQPVPSFP